MINFHCFRTNALKLRTSNLNLFAEIFQDLTDALDTINSLFTFHLIPSMLLMFLIDTFGIYGVTKASLTPDKLLDILISMFYILSHLILKTMISHIGHSTTHEAESVKIYFSKAMNTVESISEKFLLFTVLKQIEVRDLRLQNIFFVIDWKVLFGVSML